jgi:hypothetical protein
MSFNRPLYDTNTYRQDISQSVAVGHYAISEPPVSCQMCYPYPPTVRLQRQGDSLNRGISLIDVDSELLGLTRKLSNDPSMKYIPTCVEGMCNSGEVCGQGVVGQCAGHKNGQRASDNSLIHFPDCFTPWEDTRLSNPPCTLRGTGWNRWEWLCINPQDKVEVPFDWNINSQLMTKDNHRPCVPNPIDPTPALPRGGRLPCEPTVAGCAAFTMPPSVDWQTTSSIRNY